MEFFQNTGLKNIRNRKQIDLIGKYIKFNERITFEVFKILYKNLIDSGLKCNVSRDVFYSFFENDYQNLALKEYDNTVFTAYLTENEPYLRDVDGLTEMPINVVLAKCNID